MKAIGVNFYSSNKMYWYHTEKMAVDLLTEDVETVAPVGSILKIASPFGPADVKVMAYAQRDRRAGLKELDFIKIIYTPKQGEDNMTTNKIDKATESIKDTCKTVAKVAVDMQKGRAVLAALQTSLANADGVPDTVKAILLDKRYGSLAIGAILNTAAATFTGNKTIKEAAEAVVFVGAVDLSDSFTLIEALIESAINAAFAKTGVDTAPAV
jgi:hypothetical protein